MPPDIEVEDLFSGKPEPSDDTRPDCEDDGTVPGLSARDPDPNHSSTIQLQWSQLGMMCKLTINCTTDC